MKRRKIKSNWNRLIKNNLVVYLIRYVEGLESCPDYRAQRMLYDKYKYLLKLDSAFILDPKPHPELGDGISVFIQFTGLKRSSSNCIAYISKLALNEDLSNPPYECEFNTINSGIIDRPEIVNHANKLLHTINTIMEE